MKHPVILSALLFSTSSVFNAEPPKPDVVVAADGSGNFKAIQSALESIPRPNRKRVVVFIKNGIYREKIRVDAALITLRGESRTGVRIEYSQLQADFNAHPDDLGPSVINLKHADDLVLENLTAENTGTAFAGHTFALEGSGDRVATLNCDFLSKGGDTVALGRRGAGHYYHARCNFSGAVDFVCPRGWCYATDCSFYSWAAFPAIWHQGFMDPDMKFVLRNCRFDGVKGFSIGRNLSDAQFYFIDCKFSEKLADTPIGDLFSSLTGPAARKIYRERKAELDKKNRLGERNYFHNCHRASGDFAWFADNLSAARGSPKPEQITAAWSLEGKWDPESGETRPKQ